MNTVFSNIFTEILDVRLQRSGSPGQHGSHFLESAERANSELVPGLNSLIAGNVSSFPLSSTSPGILFDFSTGQPVRVTESLGPILAENAKTLGGGKFLIEANYTYLDLVEFRGMALSSMQFTFAHKDVTAEGTLGESPNESDVIFVDMDLHARSGIGVLFATLGITNSLDVSLAVPIVSVWLTGNASATVSSYTFPRLGHANHLFGSDTLNPILSTQVPYNEQATGLGDIALRLKYAIARGGVVDFAALLDARLPTGKEEDFLGSGEGALRLWAIVSRKFGDVTPHLNIGYARKWAELQSDALEFRAGFDSKLYSSLTLAVDFLGQFDLNADEAIHLAPGTARITDVVPGGTTVRVVNMSNIPDRDNDNAFAMSLGFRLAPSDTWLLFANILVPLNNGGLRASVAPTMGISAIF